MGIEIERKFLVVGEAWQQAPCRARMRLRQGYLSHGPGATVRVRLADGVAFLTVKSAEAGVARAEFEYAIPTADAEAMLATLCAPPLLEKVRHEVEHAGLIWQVDEFAGPLAGLVLTEVELASPDQVLAIPPWAGPEVTGDPRFVNAALSLLTSPPTVPRTGPSFSPVDP